METEDAENRLRKNRGENRYPVYERTDSRWTSWLIPLFIIVSIVVFVVEMYINNCPKHIDDLSFYGDSSNRKCVARFLGRFSFQPLSENPSFGPSASTLEKLGARDWYKIVHQHQAWRLISSIWLHAGIIHLVSNMSSLAFVGIPLELKCGFVRVGIIYLLSGFGGSVLSSLFIQRSITVGASGALYGLLGAILSELLTNWSLYTKKVAVILTILVIVVLNLVVGILPHVDNFAHIGGFLTGVLLGFVLLPRPQLGWVERRNRPPDIRVKPKYKAYQYVLWFISLALLIAGFTVGLIMLFRGENAYYRCHWCRYLSCVPTSKWKCSSGK